MSGKHFIIGATCYAVALAVCVALGCAWSSGVALAVTGVGFAAHDWQQEYANEEALVMGEPQPYSDPWDMGSVLAGAVVVMLVRWVVA